jgi:hypothetical protein
MGPVALAGTAFEQSWASIVLGAANVALVSIVIARMGVSGAVRMVLSLVFAFGTIVWFSAQSGNAWHFAHVVAIFFMMLTILACQRDGPTWLIGGLFAVAVLSRQPIVLAAPFFGGYLFDRMARERLPNGGVFGTLEGSLDARWPGRQGIRRFLELAIPMAVTFGVPMLLYLGYNYARFGSFFERGDQLITGVLSNPAYANGIFSVAYIPGSIQAMLLSTPIAISVFPFFEPPRVGAISMLLTSPIFLWAFRARRPDWFNIGAWASIALMLIPILTHGGSGDEQFGYRFAQDFYPFLFLLTVRGVGGRIGRWAWLAICFGFVVNLWGMAATYLDWFA